EDRIMKKLLAVILVGSSFLVGLCFRETLVKAEGGGLGAQQEDLGKCGDLNSDGNVDIGDPVFLLQFLFLGGKPPVCASPQPPSCTDAFSADFRDREIVAKGMTVSSDTNFQYNDAYHCSWRMLARGTQLEAAFDLQAVPPSSFLTLRHLSSADGSCPGGG